MCVYVREGGSKPGAACENLQSGGVGKASWHVHRWIIGVLFDFHRLGLCLEKSEHQVGQACTQHTTQNSGPAAAP